jgi:hypothetical protein
MNTDVECFEDCVSLCLGEEFTFDLVEMVQDVVARRCHDLKAQGHPSIDDSPEGIAREIRHVANWIKANAKDIKRRN